MKKSNVFLDIMSSYLTKYTVVTKGLSENTIRSYTYTFQLLFVFLKEQKDISPKRFSLKSLAETHWNSSSYGWREAVNAVSGIPKKKDDEAIPIYFTKEEISIMLHLPAGNGEVTYMNLTLLSVLYATGARAQELCDICVRDIHFGEKTSIKLVGKGRKARIVTIPAQCAALLKDYLSSVNKLTFLDSHVFSSQTNEHMTISCVEEIVKKYLRIAKMENPTLFREKKYTPHTFRHYGECFKMVSGDSKPVITVICPSNHSPFYHCLPSELRKSIRLLSSDQSGSSLVGRMST